MNGGWVKLHRKLVDNPIFKNPKASHLWIAILLLANHEPRTFVWGNKTHNLLAGQLLTGREKLSKLTGLSENFIQRTLVALENVHQIRQQTFNKFRIITVVSWQNYQLGEQENRQQIDTYKKRRSNTPTKKTTRQRMMEKLNYDPTAD